MNFKKYHVSKNLWDGAKIENCGFQSGTYNTPTYNPRNIIYIPVIGGNTYTFSINNIAPGTSFQSVCSIGKPALGVSYLINGDTTFIEHGAVTTFTRTIPNEANWWAIQIMSLDNLSNNIMINEGSTALPYEPYSSEVWHDLTDHIMSTTWQDGSTYSRSGGSWSSSLTKKRSRKKK